MYLFFQKHHRSLFYTTWLLLTIMQASSTELIADEAYYWVYSKFLSWGYFDHPPMVALLIKGGYAVFKSELGVRLVCVLLNVFTLIITESLISKKNPFLFYTIARGIAALQVTGFLAVPDTPLLFFTAVFFYCYRLYIKNINWRNALLLSLSIVLLFYTKYHGLLIVFFAFLSNIKLLLRRQTWLVAFFVLLFFAPHLLWQWEHDWVSFRYHLFESNVSAYKLSYTTDYIAGQLLITGPLAGLILLPAAILYHTKNETERALRFTLIGFFVFFLLSSFRGKVEANWTMPVLIPLIVLSHQFLMNKISWIKWLRILAFVSLLLIMAGRIYLAADIGPDNTIKNRFHHNREWAKTIAEKTGNKPVVFYNSYQRASLFWFYTGKQSHSHNAYWERKNNYNFWPIEDQLLGTPVYIAGLDKNTLASDSVQIAKEWLGLKFDSSYSALGRINIFPEKINISAGKLNISLAPEISRSYFSFLYSNKDLKTELVVGIFKGKELVKEINTGITAQQLASALVPVSILSGVSGLAQGKYDCRLGLRVKDYPVTHNSKKFALVIP